MKFDSGYKYRMKNKTYVFHSDPGHGWLAVKKSELRYLNLEQKISTYSYMKGDTVYLEEDCDASEFVKAYTECFGKRPTFKESYLENTPIRYYPRYYRS
jgi:hypothetical protein